MGAEEKLALLRGISHTLRTIGEVASDPREGGGGEFSVTILHNNIRKVGSFRNRQGHRFKSDRRLHSFQKFTSEFTATYCATAV